MGTHWIRSDISPPLSSDTIHLWRINMVVDSQTESTLFDLLALPEQRRAERFLFPKHRRRFAVGRARMRQVLARYLDSEPQDIDFQYTPLGKPSIADTTVSFNFSNSSDLGLLAVTQHLEVGVDTELLRELSDLEGLARRYFHRREIEAITACADPIERRKQFFRCWTRKEAVLKATGKGLTHPLDQLCVTVAASEPAKMVSIEGDADEASHWTLQHLLPQANYVGAIAYRSTARKLQFYDPL